MMAMLGRPLIRWLSELAAESLRQPASWQCLEIVYRNEPRKLLDRLFLNNRPARGARNRLRLLQEEICRCIEQRSAVSSPVMLASFGSGPGHEILGCFGMLPADAVVEATCLDRDAGALEYGKALAAGQGLDGRLRYVQGNVLRMDATIGPCDIAILSGDGS